ncbi:MAG: RNase H family protein [Pirellulaceae bacterium]|nr:hypothetical protein [Planctomycetales bacterium]
MVAHAPHYLLFLRVEDTATEDAGEKPVGGASGGTWEFVLETVDGDTVLEASDMEPATCGERLQLLALVRGLEALDQSSRVTVFTSSRYVRRGLRLGLPEWRARGWEWERDGRMVPVKNGDLWQRVDRALKFHTVACREWRFDVPVRMPNPEHAMASMAENVPEGVVRDRSTRIAALGERARRLHRMLERCRDQLLRATAASNGAYASYS